MYLSHLPVIVVGHIVEGVEDKGAVSHAHNSHTLLRCPWVACGGLAVFPLTFEK